MQAVHEKQLLRAVYHAVHKGVGHVIPCQEGFYTFPLAFQGYQIVCDSIENVLSLIRKSLARAGSHMTWGISRLTQLGGTKVRSRWAGL